MPTGSQIDLLFDALHRGREEDLRRLIPPLQERLAALAKERPRGQLTRNVAVTYERGTQ